MNTIDHTGANDEAPAVPAPELLCPGCAKKDFVDEEGGKRCVHCRGLLCSGARARATLAKSVAQGNLEAPQGALSCAQCADLLVPVDFEDHRFHACASCRLVWSPSGAAPSLPPSRRGKTLRFRDDRVEIRPDGTAVVVSAAPMDDWEPRKRHMARVIVDDEMYQVSRALTQEGGRRRYELVPFDSTKTMLIGPAIQYDAWYVDARDGVTADLPSPIKTAKRALLAVVILAPMVVAVLYFRPYERLLPAPPANPPFKALEGKAVPPPPPLPSVVATPPPPAEETPVAAPALPRGQRPQDPAELPTQAQDVPPAVTPPPVEAPAPKGDLVISFNGLREGRARVTINNRPEVVKIRPAAGVNYLPFAKAKDLMPGRSPTVGERLSLGVNLPGGGTERMEFVVTAVDSFVLGTPFTSHYKPIRVGKTAEVWAFTR